MGTQCCGNCSAFVKPETDTTLGPERGYCVAEPPTTAFIPGQGFFAGWGPTFKTSWCRKYEPAPDEPPYIVAKLPEPPEVATPPLTAPNRATRRATKAKKGR